MSKEITKVVIVLEGGLVRIVNSNNPNLKYVVVDHDSEDWDENNQGETVPGSSSVSLVQSPDAVAENLSELFTEDTTQDNYVKEQLKKLDF